MTFEQSQLLSTSYTNTPRPGDAAPDAPLSDSDATLFLGIATTANTIRASSMLRPVDPKTGERQHVTNYTMLGFMSYREAMIRSRGGNPQNNHAGTVYRSSTYSDPTLEARHHKDLCQQLNPKKQKRAT